MLSQLPLSKKIYYGMGAVSMNLCDMVFLQWIYVRYAPSDGPTLVSPWLIGTYMLASRVIEAIIGPMVGYWSDNFRSAGGRRLPFVRRGLLPWALAIFLLWNPPFAAGNWFNSVYLIVGIMVYLLLYNIVVTPYLALLPELTSNLRERVDVTTIQAIFLMVSAMTFALMGTVLENGGWVAMGGTVMLLTVLFMLPVALAIRERPRPNGEHLERLPFIEGLRVMLRNRAFLGIVISASFYWFGLDIILKLLPLWVKGYLGESEGTVTLLMLPFLAMNVLFFFVINVLSKRLGKYVVLLATFIATGLTFLLLPFVGYIELGSPLLQTGVVIALIGMAVSGFMSLPFAVLSDVVDYDEQLTGRRREAIFFGFQGTFQKLTLGISGYTFGRLGYDYIGDRNVVSVGGLRLLAALAGVGCLVGFFVFLGYPLREREGKLVIGKRSAK